jgi:[acyl-carrier-protein] S-malonyltransferase
MGIDLKDHPIAQEKFAQAEAILEWSVPEQCQQDLSHLSRTLYTQPCLYTIECILVDLLCQQNETPDFVAGHSLGEYVALYAAQVFDFKAGLRLVKRRSELMDEASGGMMAALMGFDRLQLDQVLDKTADVVLANDNNAGQAVISGTPTAVETVMAQVRTRRAVPLNVSGAFHSPFMAEPAAKYQALLETTEFAPAQVPVLPNVNPEPTTDAKILKARLIDQMTGSVRWRETSLQLAASDVGTVVEVGPGKVLAGLVKRTCREMKIRNIAGLGDLE